MHRYLILLLLLSCEKWPHEVDCYCIYEGLFQKNTFQDTFADDCVKRGGTVVQCEIHDIL